MSNGIDKAGVSEVWSKELRANMLRYNQPFYELAEILEQLEQKKGVIDRYGRYKPTVTTTSAGRV